MFLLTCIQVPEMVLANNKWLKTQFQVIIFKISMESNHIFDSIYGIFSAIVIQYIYIM